MAYSAAMPLLSNQRHEAFARAICRGESASKAYSSIYHVTGNNAEAAGSRLLRNVKVSERISELKEGAAKRTTKTVESLVSDLDAIIEFARNCGNPNAMVAAVNTQAKLLGLMVDRSEVTVAHKPAPLPTKILELSEQEWTAQFGTGTAPRPALSENAKAPKAKARKMNDGAHGGKPVAVVAPAIEWDAETAQIRAMRTIELD
ncbi:terminase small subunit [Rhizobium gallicum]|uniref:terminase small subunit n=1 Tax=Rhizobium gallicum TaxID=56730 RepID=UPI001EF753DA|nr:terminase small subunit [Rhizobium gallicum]ULJ70639.1 terminase small subunit [Rhizobium gallicum]